MATQTQLEYRRPRWGIYPGWWMVIAAFLQANLLYGSWYYGFTAFFNPVAKQYGWSAAETAGAFSLSRVEGGVEGPIVGVMLDTWGPMVTSAIFNGMAGLGFIAFTFTTTIIMLYVSYSLLISIGGNGGLYATSQPSIAKWFMRRRITAIGVITIGGGLAGTIWLPVYTWIIDSWSWQTAAWIAAAVQLLISLPLSLLFRKGIPEEFGLLPDGESPESRARRIERDRARAEASRAAGQVQRTPRMEYNFTVGEALRTPSWWLMAFGFTFAGAAQSTVTALIMPIQTEIGIPRLIAAGSMGTMLLLSQVGRFGITIFGDFFNIKWTYVATQLLCAIGVFCLATATDMNLVYVWMVLYGLGWGGMMPLGTPWRAAWWGRTSLGKIYTFMMPISAIGNAIGPVFTGWTFDVTGSYRGAYQILAFSLVIASVLFAIMWRPNPPKRIQQTQEWERRSFLSRLWF